MLYKINKFLLIISLLGLISSCSNEEPKLPNEPTPQEKPIDDNTKDKPVDNSGNNDPKDKPVDDNGNNDPKDKPTVEKPVDYLAKSIEMLSEKEIVLDTKAFLGEKDKTLLPKGCPTKYSFKWLAEEKKMQLSLTNFRIGKMPFAINYRSYFAFEKLDIWDKDVYTEKGWLKFQVKEGFLNLGFLTLNKYKKKPAKIEGFVNPMTEEIRFEVQYNMMNARSVCNRQKIDFKRIDNYEQELKQYEKDLADYKKAH